MSALSKSVAGLIARPNTTVYMYTKHHAWEKCTEVEADHTIGLAIQHVGKRYDVLIVDDGENQFSPGVTVAICYALAQVVSFGENAVPASKVPCISSLQWTAAQGIVSALVNADGSPSDIMKSSPNGNETISLQVLQFLSAVEHTNNDDVADAWTKIFKRVHAGNGDASVGCVTNLTALQSLCLNPTHKVLETYQDLQPHSNGVVILGLGAAADGGSLKTEIKMAKLIQDNFNWALAIKSNLSGDMNSLPAGPGNLIFTKNGKCWMTNNGRQGSGNSWTIGTVLDFTKGYAPCAESPLEGRLLGCGWGITITPDDKSVILASYGWGKSDYIPVAGALSYFDVDTGAFQKVINEAKSAVDGSPVPFACVQAVVFDGHGNLWCAISGESTPYCLLCMLNGDPDQALTFTLEDDMRTGDGTLDASFGIVITSDNVVFATCTGKGGDGTTSSCFAVKLAEDNKVIKLLGIYAPDVFKSFRGIAVDEQQGLVYACGTASIFNPANLGKELENADSPAALLASMEKERKENPQGAGGIDVFNLHDFTKKPEDGGKWNKPKPMTYLQPEDGGKGCALLSLPFLCKSDSTQMFSIDERQGVNQPWNAVQLSNGDLINANFGGWKFTKDGAEQDAYGPGKLKITKVNETSFDLVNYWDGPLTLATGGDQVMLANGSPLVSDDYPIYHPLQRLTGLYPDPLGNLVCCNNWKPVEVAKFLTNPFGDGIVVFIGQAVPGGLNQNPSE